MSNLLDNICLARDFLQQKDIYELSRKLPFKFGLFKSIFNEVNRQLDKRSKEYHQLKEKFKDNPENLKCKYQLEFTSQDLRELAKDIRSVFKRWDNIMNPEKTIKTLKKQIDDKMQLNLKEFEETRTFIMKTRLDNIKMLVDLLNLLEFYGSYLYFLEIASNDDFATTYSERL